MGGLNDPIYNRIRNSLAFTQRDLDQSLIEFPQLVLDVNAEVALAMFNRDTAKIGLDIAIAQAQADIRNSGIASGKKPAEAQVASEAVLQVTVIDAERHYANAKYILAEWQALADAVKTKGYTMKDTGALIVAGYLAPNAINVPNRVYMPPYRNE